MNRPCAQTFCKNNYAHYDRLKRYGKACMHNNKCTMMGIAQKPNVINILDRPIKEGYKYLTDLTNDELEFCLQTERRLGGLKKLIAEKRTRS